MEISDEVVRVVSNFFYLYGTSFDSYYFNTTKDVIIFTQTQPPLFNLEALKVIDMKDLVSNLRRLVPTFSEDDIILYPDGNVGIIIRHHTEEEKISELPLEMYVNLAKNLSPKDMDYLCITNKQFETLCKNNEFWRRLFLSRFGGNPPKTDTYDYRKIYTGLSILNKDELLTNMDMGYTAEEWIYRAKVFTDSIIYLFNTDAIFKENVLNDVNRQGFFIAILVISGYIEKAKRFIQYINPNIDLEKLTKILTDVYSNNHDYKIIDFLLDMYPDAANEYLLHFIISNFFRNLTDEDIVKLLSDKRIDQKVKDDTFIIDLLYLEKYTIQQIINYTKLYRSSIDKQFLFNLTQYVILYRNIVDLKFMLRQYGQMFDSEDIKNLIDSAIRARSEGMFVIDMEILYILLHMDVMEKVYKKI